MKRFKSVALAISAVLGTSTSLLAADSFVSGDRIQCFDDVSSYKYQIEIKDIGDEEVIVRIFDETGKKVRSYSSANVDFDQNDTAAEFVLLKNGEQFESIEVEYGVKAQGRGAGTYMDRGDSRGIDCEMGWKERPSRPVSCVDFRAADIRCSGGEFLTNVGCDLIEQVRCVSKLTRQEKKENLVFRGPVTTLIGELDPHVLGDSGMLIGREYGSSRQVGIYEPIDNPYAISVLENFSKLGVVVGIPLSGVHRLYANVEEDMGVVAELQLLKEKTLRVPGRAAWYEIND